MARLALPAALALLTLAACNAQSPANPSLAAQHVLPCEATSASTPVPAGCGLVCRAELPVRFRDGLPQVYFWVNGQDVTMLLDTGSVLTLLGEGAAQRLGLKPIPGKQGHVSAFGGDATISALGPADITLGHISVHAASMLMVSAPAAEAPRTSDGTIGMDILSRFEVDLDLLHRRLTLYSGRPCPGPLPGWSSEDFALPLQSAGTPGRLVSVPVRLDGTAFDALLDSGAADTVVSAAAAKRLGVAEEELRYEFATRGVGAGPHSFRNLIHRFDRLQVGTDILTNPELSVVGDAPKGLDMLLGEKYLSTRRIWISFATRQVHFASAL
jgi:predicted aspartyl protease